MNYNEFEKLIHKYVDNGLTPVICCKKCSEKTWFFEADIKKLFERHFLRKCRKCGNNDQLLLGDFNAEI